ncbi:uncharacterized protein MONOS_17300 [Monocercomonoides exilis]|uniref:uncharacterized protein n=1 Tax=Monocercomonoides exilis TaxID=2049356 RepID=UPI00355944DC|nr:hypothetical protein MONOS_17300 [Monocercomonoides exilis]
MENPTHRGIVRGITKTFPGHSFHMKNYYQTNPTEFCGGGLCIRGQPQLGNSTLPYLLMSSSQFANCTCSVDGGGLYSRNLGTVFCSNVEYHNCTAVNGKGGGFCVGDVLSGPSFCDHWFISCKSGTEGSGVAIDTFSLGECFCTTDSWSTTDRLEYVSEINQTNISNKLRSSFDAKDYSALNSSENSSAGPLTKNKSTLFRNASSIPEINIFHNFYFVMCSTTLQGVGAMSISYNSKMQVPLTGTLFYECYFSDCSQYNGQYDIIINDDLFCSPISTPFRYSFSSSPMPLVFFPRTNTTKQNWISSGLTLSRRIVSLDATIIDFSLTCGAAYFNPCLLLSMANDYASSTSTCTFLIRGNEPIDLDFVLDTLSRNVMIDGDTINSTKLHVTTSPNLGQFKVETGTLVVTKTTLVIDGYDPQSTLSSALLQCVSVGEYYGSVLISSAKIEHKLFNSAFKSRYLVYATRGIFSFANVEIKDFSLGEFPLFLAIRSPLDDTTSAFVQIEVHNSNITNCTGSTTNSAMLVELGFDDDYMIHPLLTKLTIRDCKLENLSSLSSVQGGSIWHCCQTDSNLNVNNTLISSCQSSFSQPPSATEGRGGFAYITCKISLPLFQFQKITFTNNLATYGRDIFINCIDIASTIKRQLFDINFDRQVFNITNAFYGEDLTHLMPIDLLDYITYRDTIVVVDGRDESQGGTGDDWFNCGSSLYPCRTLATTLKRVSNENETSLFVVELASIEKEVIIKRLILASLGFSSIATCEINSPIDGMEESVISTEQMLFVAFIKFNCPANLDLNNRHSLLFTTSTADIFFSNVIFAPKSDSIRSLSYSLIKGLNGKIEFFSVKAEFPALTSFASSLFQAPSLQLTSFVPITCYLSNFTNISVDSGSIFRVIESSSIDVHSVVVVNQSRFSNIKSSSSSASLLDTLGDASSSSAKVNLHVNDSSFKECSATSSEEGGVFCASFLLQEDFIVLNKTTFDLCSCETATKGRGGVLFLHCVNNDANFLVNNTFFTANNAKYGRNMFISCPSLEDAIKKEKFLVSFEQDVFDPDNTFFGNDTTGNYDDPTDVLYFIRYISFSVYIDGRSESEGGIGRDWFLCGNETSPCKTIIYASYHLESSETRPSLLVQQKTFLGTIKDFSNITLKGMNGIVEIFVNQFISGTGESIISSAGFMLFSSLSFNVPQSFTSSSSSPLAITSLVQSQGIQLIIDTCTFTSQAGPTAAVNYALIQVLAGMLNVSNMTVDSMSVSSSVFLLGVDDLSTQKIRNCTFSSLSFQNGAFISILPTSFTSLSLSNSDRSGASYLPSYISSDATQTILLDSNQFRDISHKANSPCLISFSSPNIASIEFQSGTVENCTSDKSLEGGCFFVNIPIDSSNTLFVNQTVFSYGKANTTAGKGGMFFIDGKVPGMPTDEIPIHFNLLRFKFVCTSFLLNEAFIGRDVYVRGYYSQKELHSSNVEIDFTNPSFNETNAFYGEDAIHPSIDLLDFFNVALLPVVVVSPSGADSRICGDVNAPCLTFSMALRHILTEDTISSEPSLLVNSTTALDIEVEIRAITLASFSDARAVIDMNQTWSKVFASSAGILATSDDVEIKLISFQFGQSFSTDHNSLIYQHNSTLTISSTSFVVPSGSNGYNAVPQQSCHLITIANGECTLDDCNVAGLNTTTYLISSLKGTSIITNLLAISDIQCAGIAELGIDASFEMNDGNINMITSSQSCIQSSFLNLLSFLNTTFANITLNAGSLLSVSSASSVDPSAMYHSFVLTDSTFSNISSLSSEPSVLCSLFGEGVPEYESFGIYMSTCMFLDCTSSLVHGSIIKSSNSSMFLLSSSTFTTTPTSSAIESTSSNSRTCAHSHTHTHNHSHLTPRYTSNADASEYDDEVCTWNESALYFISSNIQIIEDSMMNLGQGAICSEGGILSLVDAHFANNTKALHKCPSAQRNILCRNDGTVYYFSQMNESEANANESLWLLNEGCTLYGEVFERASSFFIPRIDSVAITPQPGRYDLLFSGDSIAPCDISFEVHHTFSNETRIFSFPFTSIENDAAAGSIPRYLIDDTEDSDEVSAYIVFWSTNRPPVTGRQRHRNDDGDIFEPPSDDENLRVQKLSNSFLLKQRVNTSFPSITECLLPYTEEMKQKGLYIDFMTGADLPCCGSASSKCKTIQKVWSLAQQSSFVLHKMTIDVEASVDQEIKLSPHGMFTVDGDPNKQNVRGTLVFKPSGLLVCNSKDPEEDEEEPQVHSTARADETKCQCEKTRWNSLKNGVMLTSVLLLYPGIFKHNTLILLQEGVCSLHNCAVAFPPTVTSASDWEVQASVLLCSPSDDCRAEIDSFDGTHAMDDGVQMPSLTSLFVVEDTTTATTSSSSSSSSSRHNVYFSISSSSFRGFHSSSSGSIFSAYNSDITNSPSLFELFVNISSCSFTSCSSERSGGAVCASCFVHLCMISRSQFVNCAAGVDCNGTAIQDTELQDKICGGALMLHLKYLLHWSRHLSQQRCVPFQSVDIDGCIFDGCASPSRGRCALLFLDREFRHIILHSIIFSNDPTSTASSQNLRSNDKIQFTSNGNIEQKNDEPIPATEKAPINIVWNNIEPAVEDIGIQDQTSIHVDYEMTFDYIK